MNTLNIKGKFFKPLANFWVKDCQFPQKFNDILIQKQRGSQFLILKKRMRKEVCTIFAFGNTTEGPKKIRFSFKKSELFNKIKLL